MTAGISFPLSNHKKLCGLKRFFFFFQLEMEIRRRKQSCLNLLVLQSMKIPLQHTLNTEKNQPASIKTYQKCICGELLKEEFSLFGKANVSLEQLRSRILHIYNRP